MLHPHFFAMVERACERGAQLKIETNAHYLDPANAAAPEGARRQGGPGQPRRRLDSRPSAACACAASSTASSTACATCATQACRSRSTSRRRASTCTRSTPWSTSPTSSAPTASTPAGRCTPAMPSRPRRHLEVTEDAVRRVLRRAAREDRASTAGACASTSTRPGCSRSCAIASSTRRPC